MPGAIIINHFSFWPLLQPVLNPWRNCWINAETGRYCSIQNQSAIAPFLRLCRSPNHGWVFPRENRVISFDYSRESSRQLPLLLHVDGKRISVIRRTDGLLNLSQITNITQQLKFHGKVKGSWIPRRSGRTESGFEKKY